MKKITAQVKSNAPLLSIIIGYSIFVLTILVAYSKWNLDSDFVAVQTMIKNGLFTKNSISYVNADTFIIKYPLYLLTNLFAFNNKIVLLQSLLQFSIGYALYGFAFMYFSKKLKFSNISILANTTWVSSTSVLLGLFFLNPNSRVLEFGFVFLLYVIIDFYAKKNKYSIAEYCLLIFIIIFYGFITYSDPLIFYMGIVPAILYFAYLYVSSRYQSKYLVSAGLLTAIYPIYKIYGFFFENLGIRPVNSGAIISFNGLTNNLKATFMGFLTLFNANIFNSELYFYNFILAFANIICLGTLLALCLKLQEKDSKPNRNSFNWVVFFKIAVIVNLLIYAVSKHDIDSLSYRYLILIPFLLILVFSYQLTNVRIKLKGPIVTILLFSAVLNTILLTNMLISPIKRIGQVDPYITNSINSYVGQNGYTKIYAPYWEANITTYNSNNKTLGIPIDCDSRKLKIFKWWINDNAVNKPVDKVILVYDKLYLGSCSQQDVESQIGTPSSSYKINDRVTLFEYNVDILNKLNY